MWQECLVQCWHTGFANISESLPCHTSHAGACSKARRCSPQRVTVWLRLLRKLATNQSRPSIAPSSEVSAPRQRATGTREETRRYPGGVNHSEPYLKSRSITIHNKRACVPAPLSGNDDHHDLDWFICHRYGLRSSFRDGDCVNMTDGSVSNDREVLHIGDVVTRIRWHWRTYD